MLYILLIENPAAEDDGDFFIEFFFKFPDHVENFTDFFFIAIAFMHFDLFPGISQMAASFWPFDDHQVRSAIVVPRPELQNDPGRLWEPIMGAILVSVPSTQTGRSAGRPAPEKMISAPFSAAVRA